mmetsp:Transcript_6496/g.13004  ORF Transcript_6496/g.13004 Transcript_6496/m.13004 type:complete len:87 (+) Transcript_6496:667-927(+)
MIQTRNMIGTGQTLEGLITQRNLAMSVCGKRKTLLIHLRYKEYSYMGGARAGDTSHLSINISTIRFGSGTCVRRHPQQFFDTAILC